MQVSSQEDWRGTLRSWLTPLGRPPLMTTPVLSSRMPWFPSAQEPWQDHGCLSSPHQAPRGEGLLCGWGPREMVSPSSPCVCPH